MGCEQLRISAIQSHVNWRRRRPKVHDTSGMPHCWVKVQERLVGKVCRTLGCL